MSKSRALRALVNERLSVAAEEIFALFEKTIVEYEEELCRFKEERQQMRSTGVLQPHREEPDPEPDLKQEISETQVKQEPEDQEDDELQGSFPESSGVCVDTRFQQGQTEDTQGEDISSSETEGDTEHSVDTDNEWGPPFVCVDVQLETDSDGDHCNKDQIKDRSTKLSQNRSGSETCAVNNGLTSGIYEGAESSVCPPYNCFTCKKPFSKKSNQMVHKGMHTGCKKAYSCSLCDKSYSHQNDLKSHMRTHTGEKLHSCTMCEKIFNKKSHLDIHMRSHTGEKPYSCAFCDKAFSVNSNLTRHLRTHTEEKS